ncbi:TIGR04141 family sporadically distributed protein [Cedecea davisae]|uniref:TIGR04141 family sporadically distributed protein n=1 Tax=Cedecea davisae TaxID=158484 RepID=A0ABS6DE16_9ENTR|nr:DUF6119 family protein [Cedecea davisae]MBU4681442.1 TIGR04141 family sporadically distributed protein [Cedecea davisae]MBU4686520.1 TIGR04141 family sporadically distributed protein [Cedecea davisae]
MSKSKLERMTIFRAKDSVDGFSAIFDLTTESLPKFSYKSGDYDISGVIKYSEVGGEEKTELDYPWINMVNNLSNDFSIKFSAKNKTPSAVIGVKIKKDDEIFFFLITFGMHTSRFINTNKLVNDFGIKVAMNICDQNQLRKVNTTTHSSISTLTDRQASKGASLDIFDINDEKEFFRSISGLTYENYPFIKSFSGKNSITINMKKDLSIDNDELVNILLSLNEAYQLHSYKDKFPTYDRMDYVSDSDDIKNLDDLIFEKLKKSDLSRVHLAPHEIESDEFSHYTYKDPNSEKNTEMFDTLDIEDLINQHGKFNAKSSIETLKNWKIYTVSISGEINSMRAYNCLNCEIVYDNTTYILASGIWRSINSDFKLSIDDYIKNNIKSNDSSYLPNSTSIYCIVNEKGVDRIRYKEEIYNSYVASNCKDIYLFDKSKINIAGKKQYEICDLLHLNKELIHVKVLKDGTSSLSHLFLQARFYTDAFIKDQNTRLSMREFINDNENKENENKEKGKYLDIVPESRENLHAPSYSVILCILTFDDEKTLDSLPFMVRYELAKTHKYLNEERGVKLFYALRTVTKEKLTNQSD